MRLLRVATKGLAFAVIIAGYMVAGLLLILLRGHRAQDALTSATARLLVRVLGLRVLQVDHAQPAPEGVSRLIVANHLGYLDAVTFASIREVKFVTSIEVRDSFFLGHLARLTSCLFVERRSRAGLPAEIRAIATALKTGLSVALFPEGTSSCGEGVLPFKRPLFEAATLAGKQVDLYCIRYRSIDGKPFGPENRDRVCYYGDHDFLPNFLGFLAIREAVVEYRYLGALDPRDFGSVSELASEAHRRISNAYAGIPESSRLALELGSLDAFAGGQPALVAGRSAKQKVH